MFVLDHPVALAAGSTVRVLWHAEGGEYPVPTDQDHCGARAIATRDVNPSCRVVNGKYVGHLPTEWDQVARLYVHSP